MRGTPVHMTFANFGEGEKKQGLRRLPGGIKPQSQEGSGVGGCTVALSVNMVYSQMRRLDYRHPLSTILCSRI